MRRSLLTLFVVLAACGGAAVEDPGTTSEVGPSTSTSAAPDTSGSPVTSEAPATTETSDDTTTTNSDLPIAPDFTLELGNGGEYRLSDSQRPVYLVFWAEW